MYYLLLFHCNNGCKNVPVLRYSVRLVNCGFTMSNTRKGKSWLSRLGTCSRPIAQLVRWSFTSSDNYVLYRYTTSNYSHLFEYAVWMMWMQCTEHLRRLDTTRHGCYVWCHTHRILAELSRHHDPAARSTYTNESFYVETDCVSDHLRT